MREKYNLSKLCLSTLLTLLSAYVLPCRQIDAMNKSFGFPFGWFNVHDNTIGDVILSSTAVNLLIFLVDVAVFYLIIAGICKLRRLMAKNKAERHMEEL